MGRRKHGLDPRGGMDNLVRQIRRRKHIDVDPDTPLGRKQRKISAIVQQINDDERDYRDRVVRNMEATIANEPDLARRVNLQNALDRFRAGHVDNGASLEDLSGKIRTEREANELLDRLSKHKMTERTTRMRSNYDKALRAKGYDEVADYVAGLNDEKFLLGFYFGNNLEMGFEYKIDWDGESTLMQNWKDIQKVIRGRSNKRTRENTKTRLSKYSKR